MAEMIVAVRTRIRGSGLSIRLDIEPARIA
jgi:hypothetical protein